MLADLDRLSPKELKSKFTRLTGLPAKQNFVWLACPSLANCKIRSKNDWILAIESIEMILRPMFGDDPNQDEAELPQAEPHVTPPSPSSVQPVDAEISVVLNALNDEDRDQETVFQCGFLLASDHKHLYRKLAQRFHPDKTGDEDAELFIVMNAVYKQLTQESETYGSGQEDSELEGFVTYQQRSEESLEESLSRQLGEDFEW